MAGSSTGPVWIGTERKKVCLYILLFQRIVFRLFPVIEPGMSDSGCVDNAVEFLVMAGKRSLPEVSLHSLF